MNEIARDLVAGEYCWTSRESPELWTKHAALQTHLPIAQGFPNFATHCIHLGILINKMYATLSNLTQVQCDGGIGSH